MIINVLGTDYEICKKKYKEESRFEKDDIDGYCNGLSKKIVYCDMKTHPNFESESEEALEACEKEILRHEVFHAFLNESGLADNTMHFDGGWSRNEEMIDWFAIQSPKIFKVYQKINIL